MNYIHPPLRLAGVGGSGTRIIAQILSDAGLQIGGDLNLANDDLLYTFLFRRPELFDCTESVFSHHFSMFKKLRVGGKSALTSSEISRLESLYDISPPQYNQNWCEQRKAKIEADKTAFIESRPWGWKEPNTHFNIEKILHIEPSLKYLHVMRNGLDMAYSNNQNQLKLWGQYVFDGNFEISPLYSLKFWRLVHERVNRVCKQYTDSIYIINFDKLCQSPVTELTRVFQFLGIDVSAEDLLKHANKVQIPKSIGRHQLHSLKDFDSDDIAFTQQMGF